MRERTERSSPLPLIPRSPNATLGRLRQLRVIFARTIGNHFTIEVISFK